MSLANSERRGATAKPCFSPGGLPREAAYMGTAYALYIHHQQLLRRRLLQLRPVSNSESSSGKQL